MKKTLGFSSLYDKENDGCILKVKSSMFFVCFLPL